jgi:cytochrome c biogenesis protein CcmG, thiol:disulfide interchange protein DsbE
MKRLIAFAPMAVLCVVLAVLAFYNFTKRPQYEPRAMIGKPVPTLVLNGLKDARQSDLKALAAKYKRPILLNLFASWCVPCKAENGVLLDLKSRGVIIIGVAHKDDPLKSLNFLKIEGDPYAEVFSDDDGRLFVDLGMSGLPETFLITPDGVIKDKVGGPLTEDNLAPLLAGLNQ